jgi:hypothetical protein
MLDDERLATALSYSFFPLLKLFQLFSNLCSAIDFHLMAMFFHADVSDARFKRSSIKKRRKKVIKYDIKGIRKQRIKNAGIQLIHSMNREKKLVNDFQFFVLLPLNVFQLRNI